MPDLTGAYDPADEPGDLFPPRAHSDPDHRYTLDEARAIIAREQCDAEGHDLDQTLLRVPSGRVVRRIITCDRCHATFRETTTP